MEITNTTTVGEALPFLKPEHIEELMKSEKVQPLPYHKSVFEMTVGEFIECLDDKFAESFFKNPEELLVTAMGTLKHFRNELDSVNKILKLNEVKLTPEETAAQRGVVFPSFQESILCECVEWFHLHSIDDAEKLPFSNWLIMKRKRSADVLFERNLNKLYSDKSKKKK